MYRMEVVCILYRLFPNKKNVYRQKGQEKINPLIISPFVTHTYTKKQKGRIYFYVVLLCYKYLCSISGLVIYLTRNENTAYKIIDISIQQTHTHIQM